MTHVTCRLTAKNRDQLRNPALGNRVWATFTFLMLALFTSAYSLRGHTEGRVLIRTVEVDWLVADGGLWNAGDAHLLRVVDLSVEWTAVHVDVAVFHRQHVLTCRQMHTCRAGGNIHEIISDNNNK